MKTFFQYLLMVGLPLVGVLIILQLGNRLVAPTSVGGDWQLTMTSNADCPLADTLSEATMLKISQSGPDLQLSLSSQPDVNLSARLDKQTLRAESTSDKTILGLTAVINRESEPNRLEGEITAYGCPAQLTFSATRLPKNTTASLQSH